MTRGIEASLQDKFINLLKRENILYIKNNGGLSYLPSGKSKITRLIDNTYNGNFRPIKQKEGFADVIVFYEIYCNPWTIFIELKTNDGKLRDSQIEKFNQLKELDFNCFILRPKHWEKAKLKGKLSFENVLNEMEKY